VLIKLGDVHTKIELDGILGGDGDGHKCVKCSTLERRKKGASLEAKLYVRAFTGQERRISAFSSLGQISLLLREEILCKKVI
jgi:hypothetical protein